MGGMTDDTTVTARRTVLENYITTTTSNASYQRQENSQPLVFNVPKVGGILEPKE